MSSFHVGKLTEYAVGTLHRLDLDGVDVCLARTADGIYAISDQCSHEGASLSEGDIIGRDVLCPMHNSRFDLVTGAVKGLPAQEPVASYAVKVVEGEVFVEI